MCGRLRELTDKFSEGTPDVDTVKGNGGLLYIASTCYAVTL